MLSSFSGYTVRNSICSLHMFYQNALSSWNDSERTKAKFILLYFCRKSVVSTTGIMHCIQKSNVLLHFCFVLQRRTVYAACLGRSDAGVMHPEAQRAKLLIYLTATGGAKQFQRNTRRQSLMQHDILNWV